MIATRRTGPAPFFSICIPQYNRTDHLLVAVRTLAGQTERDIEICISDDQSPEGRHDEIVAALEATGLDYAYHVNPRTLRYDGNLRTAISLARGRYCFLHGNDDCLVSPGTLAGLRQKLEAAGCPAVAITNFEDYSSAAPHRRVRAERLVPGDAGVAAGTFRNFSFVTGIMLDRARSAALETDHWDGSEMYQMYLGTAMIAGRAGLLLTPDISTRKDVVIEGQRVDSFLAETARPSDGWRPIVRPVHSLARLVVDAIRRGTGTAVPAHLPVRVCLQLYAFTLPYWMVQCRAHKGWRYAFRFNLASRPGVFARGIGLGPLGTVTAWTAYLTSSVAGLAAPVGLVRGLFPWLYRLRNVIR